MLDRTRVGATRDDGTYRLQVLDRVFRILDVLAEASEELGPSDLAARIPLSKSTVHRLLVVLERHRFVRQGSRRGKYTLGVRLFELGSRAVARLDLRNCAEPFLQRLVNETGETAHICVLSGTEMLSLATVEGAFSVRAPAAAGRRTEIHCSSSGKALVACMPESAVDELIARLTFGRYTRHTLTSPQALRAELRRVRAQGFAVNNEEYEQGLRCIAAPVFDYTGRAIASMCIAGPVFRIKRRLVPGLGRIVIRVALELSKELGYKAADARDKTRTGGVS